MQAPRVAVPRRRRPPTHVPMTPKPVARPSQAAAAEERRRRHRRRPSSKAAPVAPTTVLRVKRRRETPGVDELLVQLPTSKRHASEAALARLSLARQVDSPADTATEQRVFRRIDAADAAAGGAAGSTGDEASAASETQGTRRGDDELAWLGSVVAAQKRQRSRQQALPRRSFKHVDGAAMQAGHKGGQSVRAAAQTRRRFREVISARRSERQSRLGKQGVALVELIDEQDAGREPGHVLIPVPGQKKPVIEPYLDDARSDDADFVYDYFLAAETAVGAAAAPVADQDNEPNVVLESNPDDLFWSAEHEYDDDFDDDCDTEDSQDSNREGNPAHDYPDTEDDSDGDGNGDGDGDDDDLDVGAFGYSEDDMGYGGGGQSLSSDGDDDDDYYGGFGRPTRMSQATGYTRYVVDVDDDDDGD